MLLNHDSLVKSFGNYLITSGVIDKTCSNYTRDLILFFSWVSQHHPNLSISHITSTTIHSYIHFLHSQQKSIATVNRRLSTLRLFFRFALEQTIITSNPIDTIPNLVSKERHIQQFHILTSYLASLRQHGHSPHSIKTEQHVIKDFLTWIHTKPTQEKQR